MAFPISARRGLCASIGASPGTLARVGRAGAGARPREADDHDAIMDVLAGKYNPTGKLPFALAGNAQALLRQASDAPGYDKADTLFPFGFGLSY